MFVVPVSVAENVGVTPETRLLLTSARVIVTVEVADPSATTGVVPVIDEFAATGVPAVKITVPSAFTTGVAIERILDSAFRDVIVQVDTPEASVTEQDPYAFVVPVSVAIKVGISPETVLLFASRRVIVIVDVADPSATIGVVPVIFELAATGDPAVKTTVPSAFTTGVAMERVFVSALRDVIVHVETPEAFVIEQDP